MCNCNIAWNSVTPPPPCPVHSVPRCCGFGCHCNAGRVWVTNTPAFLWNGPIELAPGGGYRPAPVTTSGTPT